MTEKQLATLARIAADAGKSPLDMTREELEVLLATEMARLDQLDATVRDLKASR